jgi:DNA topoisomerase-1
MTQLMIVESPAKAKKISGYLGSGWQVLASMGHVCDLPAKALGVQTDDDFTPTYEVLPNKGKVVVRLTKAIQQASAIYVATDPDREGEAIAWHILKLAKAPKDKPIYRVTFNAITADAVKSAVASPRPLDMPLIEAQQTRRIVDRLVGYLTSPLACQALDGRYSAGRVQSACLRLIVERERAISAFIPQAYQQLALRLSTEAISFGGTVTGFNVHCRGCQADRTGQTARPSVHDINLATIRIASIGIIA